MIFKIVLLDGLACICKLSGLGEENVFGQGIAKVEYEEFYASDMHDNPEKAAEFGMPDNGQGEKQVFRIVDSEREKVAEGKSEILKLRLSCYDILIKQTSTVLCGYREKCYRKNFPKSVLVTIGKMSKF